MTLVRSLYRNLIFSSVKTTFVAGAAAAGAARAGWGGESCPGPVPPAHHALQGARLCHHGLGGLRGWPWRRWDSSTLFLFKNIFSLEVDTEKNTNSSKSGLTNLQFFINFSRDTIPRTSWTSFQRHERKTINYKFCGMFPFKIDIKYSTPQFKGLDLNP